MMPNIDPDSTRAAQDEFDEESPFERSELAPTSSRTVGRGGYGNNLRKIQTNQSYQQNATDDSPGKTDICAKLTAMFS